MTGREIASDYFIRFPIGLMTIPNPPIRSPTGTPLLALAKPLPQQKPPGTGIGSPTDENFVKMRNNWS